jgi:hypothetical protein
MDRVPFPFWDRDPASRLEVPGGLPSQPAYPGKVDASFGFARRSDAAEPATKRDLGSASFSSVWKAKDARACND